VLLLATALTYCHRFGSGKTQNTIALPFESISFVTKKNIEQTAQHTIG